MNKQLQLRPCHPRLNGDSCSLFIKRLHFKRVHTSIAIAITQWNADTCRHMRKYSASHRKRPSCRRSAVKGRYGQRQEQQRMESRPIDEGSETNFAARPYCLHTALPQLLWLQMLLLRMGSLQGDKQSRRSSQEKENTVDCYWIVPSSWSK